MNRFLACLASGFLFAATVLHSQAPAPFDSLPLAQGKQVAAASNVRFEVASVRPSGPLPPGARSGRGGIVTSTPERLTYERATMQRLLMDAYGVGRGQIKGGPAWATADTVDGAALFDISAKVPPGATKEQVATMLQNLLKERFKLAVHREATEVSGFALVTVRGGPKLKVSAGPPRESERNQTVKGAMILQIGSDGFPELAPGRNMGGIFKDGTARMRFRDYPLSDLVQQLSFALGVQIVDKTGLGGTYDFTLEFTPPETGTVVAMMATMGLNPGQTAPLKGNPPNPAQVDTLPTISSAMERQLGLKLEGTRVASDSLVIDHVERTPIEN